MRGRLIEVIRHTVSFTLGIAAFTIASAETSNAILGTLIGLACYFLMLRLWI